MNGGNTVSAMADTLIEAGEGAVKVAARNAATFTAAKRPSKTTVFAVVNAVRRSSGYGRGK